MAEVKVAERKMCECRDEEKDIYHVHQVDLSEVEHELDSLDVFFCRTCCYKWYEA